MSRPKQNHLQCASSRGQNIYAAAGRSFTFPESTAGPVCATCDSTRMHKSLRPDDSIRFLNPRNQQHVGRAFNPLLDTTKARLTRAQNTLLCSPDRSSDINNTTDDTCYYFLTNPAETSDRVQNSFFDEPANRLAKAQKQQQFRRFAQNEDCMNLESDVVKNRLIALRRLREEQRLAAYNAQRQAQFSMAARKARQQQSEEKLEAAYKKLPPNYRNADQRMDANQYYNNNSMPAHECRSKSGRPMDIDRDLTYRRLNLPTPKKNQRNRSCPTPINNEKLHSLIHDLPKTYRRPAQPKDKSVAIPLTPSEARLYETPEYHTPKRLLQKRADNLVKHPISSARPPPVPASATADNLLKTTTTTTTKQIPPAKANQKTAQKTAETSSTKISHSKIQPPQETKTPQQKAQHKKNIPQDYSPELDTNYGQISTGPTARIQNTIKPPTKPLNETNQIVNKTLNQTAMAEDSFWPLTNSQQEIPAEQASITTITYETLFPTPENYSPTFDANSETIKKAQRMWQTVDANISTSEAKRAATTQIHPPAAITYSPIASTPSGRRASEIPDNCFADDTQYAVDDMDISIQTFPAMCAEEFGREHSWRIPLEDFTCIDRSNVSQQITIPPTSTTMQTSVQTLPMVCETLDYHRPASTQYLELPTRVNATAYYAPTSCRPCEQPKASFFNCLAKKLVSTYNFISSLVATPAQTIETLPPQVMDQTMEQICDQSTFGTPPLYSTTNYEEMAYGLDDPYDTPCGHEFAEEPPVSVKECANSKRCGHVQFDSADKRELQDPQRTALRQAKMSSLINDAYCPGLIQETLDGLEDFNNYSFNMQSYRDADDPMTLLEAFSLRLDKEKADMIKDLKEDLTKEQIVESIEQHFAKHNPTDLNRAIKSFLLSEQLLDRDEMEKAKNDSFEAEVHKLVTDWPGCKNKKLISYTGLTRPFEESEQLVLKKSN